MTAFHHHSISINAMPHYTPLLTLLFFSLSTTVVSGLTPSNLSTQSYPESILQSCLDAVFTDASFRTFPQDVDYFSKINAYNLDYPVYPAAIVRPTTVEQVSATVKCAVKASVKVQPRSGGHSFANYCLGGVDGALVVDLVHLQKFDMDTATWRATIGAGTLLGDVTKRLHDAGGRAIAHGTCPQVGVGGGLISWFNLSITLNQFITRTCYHRWLRSNFTSMGFHARPHSRSRSCASKRNCHPC